MKRTISIEVRWYDVEIDFEIEAIRHRAQPPCYRGPNEGFPGQPQSFEIQNSELVGVYLHIGGHTCPVQIPESARRRIVEHLTEVHADQIVEQLVHAVHEPFEDRT